MSTPATPIVEQEGSSKPEEEEPDIQITDEVLEDMWVQYKANPNFFAQIEIASDGGFSEVDELIGGARYITAAIAISFVLLNAYSIISINLVNITNDNPPTLFLVSKQLVEYIGAGNLPSGVQRVIDNDTAILGWLEISIYAVYVARMFWNVFQISFPSTPMTRWVGVQEFFWNSMPEAATISAVKLLNFVTPAVLIPGLLFAMNPGRNGCAFAVGRTAWFLFTRILALFLGFDAFLFKLQTVSTALWDNIDNNRGAFVNLTLSFTFLNQMLGIVQLAWFVRKRIFAFIFAGEDGTLSPEEEAIKEVWESMLAQRIWQDLKPVQAIVAYLSYSDFDFQKLALETVEGKPGKDKSDKPKSARRMERERLAANRLMPPQEVEMTTPQ